VTLRQPDVRGPGEGRRPSLSIFMSPGSQSCIFWSIVVVEGTTDFSPKDDHWERGTVTMSVPVKKYLHNVG
jgi:hypothetical protein